MLRVLCHFATITHISVKNRTAVLWLARYYETASNIKEVYMSISGDMKRTAEEAKDKSEEMMDNVKDKAHDLDNKLHEKKGEMKGRIDQAKHDA